MPHLEYQELTEDDPNFIKEYRILIEESQDRDRQEARAAEGSNRERRPQAMGIQWAESDLVRTTSLSAAALLGSEYR